MSNEKKPPIGVPDLKRWLELRVSDLQRAIQEYTLAGLDFPVEWEIELRAHYHQIKQL